MYLRRTRGALQRRPLDHPRNRNHEPDLFPEKIHDLIGVGFGPSNLALAIALEELAETNGHALDALFIDKQTDYRWHGNTLATRVSCRSPSSGPGFAAQPTSPTAS